jgi:hypothetical protein
VARFRRGGVRAAHELRPGCGADDFTTEQTEQTETANGNSNGKGNHRTHREHRPETANGNCHGNGNFLGELQRETELSFPHLLLLGNVNIIAPLSSAVAWFNAQTERQME